MKKDVPKIKVDTNTYLSIASGKPVKLSQDIIKIAFGKKCKIIDNATNRVIFYHLKYALGDYGYWVK